MRWSLAPPQAKGGMYLGGRTPSNTFAPAAGAALGAAVEPPRAVPYIEAEAGFHGGIAQSDRGRIAEHDASRGEGVAVAEQAVQVVGEQPLEGGDQVVGAVKHDARHLDRGGVRLRTVPRGSRSDAPSHRDAAAREAEGAVRERGSEPARREGRGSNHRRPGDGATGDDGWDTGLGEPGQMGQGEDRGRLGADKRLPPLADQMRTRP